MGGDQGSVAAFPQVSGGKDGIRTHGGLATSTVFEVADRHPYPSAGVALVRSELQECISPRLRSEFTQLDPARSVRSTVRSKGPILSSTAGRNQLWPGLVSGSRRGRASRRPRCLAIPAVLARARQLLQKRGVQQLLEPRVARLSSLAWVREDTPPAFMTNVDVPSVFVLLVGMWMAIAAGFV